MFGESFYLLYGMKNFGFDVKGEIFSHCYISQYVNSQTKCKDVYRRFEAQLFKFIRTTDQAFLSGTCLERNHQVTEYHIDIVLYNSQSILPYIISFLPHKKTDTLVGEILYSTSSKAEAE